MSNPCRSMQSNTEAHALCRFLVHRKKVPLSAMDTGVSYVSFEGVDPYSFKTKPFISTVKGTKGNRILETGEIYDYALRLLERERNFTGPAAPGSLSRHLSKIPSFRPPWILDDFNPRTRIDATLRRTIARAVAKMQRSLAAAGHRPNTISYNTRLAHEIVEWVVRPQKRGGLGVIPIEIEPTKVTAETDALRKLTSRNRKAHCTELNHILYEIFGHAGIPASFLLVFRDDVSEAALSHVCIGIRLDPRSTRITPVDLTYYKRNEWIGTPHVTAVAMPRATMMASYFNNKAGLLYNTSRMDLLLTSRAIRQGIATNLKRAMNYDPHYPLFHLNMAKFHSSIMGDLATSRIFLRSALKLYPHILEPELPKGPLVFD